MFPKKVCFAHTLFIGGKIGDDKLLIYNKFLRNSKTRNALRTWIKFRRNNFYTLYKKKRRTFRVGLLNTQAIQLVIKSLLYQVHY